MTKMGVLFPFCPSGSVNDITSFQITRNMSMLLKFFKKVCARIEAGIRSKRGRIAAVFSEPEHTNHEHSTNSKCNQASIAASDAMNTVSLWRLLCGNIPSYSLFNFP